MVNSSQDATLSVVVPFLDEAPNLLPLHRELDAALQRLGIDAEIVFVDDGSTDHGPDIVHKLAQEDRRVRLVRLTRNYGQSTALVAGVEAASGRWIATLDADRQNDPADLPKLWSVIASGEADVVNGVRQDRDDSFVRRASSWIANRVRDRVSGDNVTDVGCSLRIFPRQAFLACPRFEGMHRFLPTLLAMRGCRVTERPVSHRPRVAGESKYGINNRLWRGLADLLMVRRLRTRAIAYETRDSERDDR